MNIDSFSCNWYFLILIGNLETEALHFFKPLIMILNKNILESKPFYHIALFIDVILGKFRKKK